MLEKHSLSDAFSVMPRRRGKRSKARPTSSVVSLAPTNRLLPQWRENLTFKRWFRFAANGNSVTVLASDVFAWLVSSVGTASVRSLINAFRLRRFRLVDVAGQPVSLTLQGTTIGGSTVSGSITNYTVSDVGNAQYPARVDVRPQKGSACDLWYTGAGTDTSLFIASAASNSGYFDVELEFTITGANTGFTFKNSVPNGLYFGPMKPSATAPQWLSASVQSTS